MKLYILIFNFLFFFIFTQNNLYATNQPFCNNPDLFNDNNLKTNQKIQHHSGIDLHKYFVETTGIITGTIITNNHPDRARFPNADLCPFIYSFSIDPEKYQPSGSCNFSRLDNAILTFTINQQVPTPILTGISVKIYGINYNVLRIMSGMGGLAYSN